MRRKNTKLSAALLSLRPRTAPGRELFRINPVFQEEITHILRQRSA